MVWEIVLKHAIIVARVTEEKLSSFYIKKKN